MINISVIKIIVFCFILIFISGTPVSQESEANIISEIVCEDDDLKKSETKDSLRSERKYVLKVMNRSFATITTKFKNYFESPIALKTRSSFQHFNSGNFIFVKSFIYIYPEFLQYSNSYKSNNFLFVNISRLKHLRISKMRC